MGSIYKITNTVNQKHYIGISIHEPETGRIKKHLTGHGNRILANAVKKYGRDAFVYEILEENIFPDLLPDLEIAYIAKYNTVRPNGYNLTYGGESCKKVSEETREKISRANRGKPAHNKGKSLSKETREKMSLNRRGKPSHKKGKPLSKETREKMSRAHRGKSFSKEHREKLRRAQQGKSPSQETREKLSLANRGKTYSQETREKISRNRCSPDKKPARELFFSLPTTLPLSERRKIVQKKFPERGSTTIHDWVRQWENEGTPIPDSLHDINVNTIMAATAPLPCRELCRAASSPDCEYTVRHATACRLRPSRTEDNCGRGF